MTFTFYYIYKTDSLKLTLLEIIFLIISYSSLLSKTAIFLTKKQPRKFVKLPRLSNRLLCKIEIYHTIVLLTAGATARALPWTTKTNEFVKLYELGINSMIELHNGKTVFALAMHQLLNKCLQPPVVRPYRPASHHPFQPNTLRLLLSSIRYPQSFVSSFMLIFPIVKYLRFFKHQHPVFL